MVLQVAMGRPVYLPDPVEVRAQQAQQSGFTDLNRDAWLQGLRAAIEPEVPQSERNISFTRPAMRRSGIFGSLPGSHEGLQDARSFEPSAGEAAHRRSDVQPAHHELSNIDRFLERARFSARQGGTQEVRRSPTPRPANGSDSDSGIRLHLASFLKIQDIIVRWIAM